MAEKKDEKICFVIAPIGEEKSETRRRSDQILHHIIEPVAAEFGYKSLRADDISKPGIITAQVIQHLIDDPLVIADLTGHNPNVFYELAVRHALRKPIVQIIEQDENIPFDVGQFRTIFIDHKDLDSVAKCKEELARQILSGHESPENIDSPISNAVVLKALHESENPLAKSSEEIIQRLSSLASAITEIKRGQQSEKTGVAINLDLIKALSFNWNKIRRHLNADITKFAAADFESLRNELRQFNDSISMLDNLVAFFQPILPSTSKKKDETE